MTEPGIRTADPRDGERVGELIAGAFHDLGAAVWLVPDPALRLRRMSGQFRIIVEHAVEHGRVDVIEDGTAAAVWLPWDGPPPDDYERRLEAACGPSTARFQVLDELFEKVHPSAPHQHLALLGVAPAGQGAGLGTRLLEHRHRELDATGTPAYLEASNERSRALYLRHGYRDSGEPFSLPGVTPFYPMWRDPVRT